MHGRQSTESDRFNTRTRADTPVSDHQRDDKCCREKPGMRQNTSADKTKVDDVLFLFFVLLLLSHYLLLVWNLKTQSRTVHSRK